MLKQLINIETAFRHVQIFTGVLLVVFGIVTCYAVERSYQKIEQMQTHIYVLANGKAFYAAMADKKDNVPVEARDHIKTFHQFFFNLAPDNAIIQANLVRALNLADYSAKVQYDMLRESGYYDNIITSGITQEVSVDSIQVSTGEAPYYFKFYGKERIARSSTVLTRNLITEGYLRNMNFRSDDNPHGFLVERWKILNNSDIKNEKR
ncbi:conjugative transposon protein TraK [Chitinophaga costaii]|nr:conjugative transposon protein TraK [Chitinophaga costaii]